MKDGNYKSLVEALKSVNVNIAEAYVINSIPEQAEDIYAVLVSESEVCIVEVPRGEGQVVIAREALAKYKTKCSKVQRLKIAVAQDLLASSEPNS